MTSSINIAVIGAGLAGLACASALQQAGFNTQVFDKSRSPGGRMSTRRHVDERGEGWQCDHGAQYFTARDATFVAEVQRWQQAGVAALWSPRIQVLGDGAPREPGPTARFVGTPRMTAPAQWLAQSVNLATNTTLRRLQRDGAHWRLLSAERGQLETAFDAVLLAVPAPQALALVEPHAALLPPVRMRGSWAVILQFAAPVALPFDAAFVNRGPLRWIARDSSKPGRDSGREIWLLHAEAEWSESHLERPADEVAALLLQAFAELGGPAPQAWSTHRWRYADTAPPLALGSIWAGDLALGLGGDWLGGGKVEGAWLSGRRLAAQVARHFA